MNENLIEHFEELKVLVETLQKDVVKNSQGNKSAGVRARKGLRQIKKMATDIVRLSLESLFFLQIKIILPEELPQNYGKEPG